MFDKISLVRSEMDSQSDEVGDVMGGPSMLRASLVPVGPKVPEIRFEQLDIDIDLDLASHYQKQELNGNQNGHAEQHLNGNGDAPAAAAGQDKKSEDSKKATKLLDAK